MALTEPLLHAGEEDKDKDTPSETPDESTVENGEADPATATTNGDDDEPEGEESTSVLAGLIVWSPIGLLVDPKQRRYPGFQWGYETPVCGNPLPAGLAAASTPAVEQAWKDLVEALDGPIAAHQKKRCRFLTGVLVALFVLLPLLAPLMRSHPAKSVFLFPLLNLSAVCVCHIVLQCWVDTPLQLALKTVVIDHNPVLKDRARARMKLSKKRYPIFGWELLPTHNPLLYKVCCACFYVQDTVLVLEAYVPPEEREAQIAFV